MVVGRSSPLLGKPRRGTSSTQVAAHETRTMQKTASSSAMAASPGAMMEDVRLSGTVLKRNAGFLRQWRSRFMIVTSDGFLRWEKKKGDSGNGVKMKEADLVKSEIEQALILQNNHYCIDVRCGQNHFVLGFTSKTEAKLWQEMMIEVADSNATGRRTWVAQLRRVLSLTLRDRRDIVQTMGDRDWLTEWNFCWKSLQGQRDQDFNVRRRRLKRLYTIWLQFQMFAEVVAEIHFSTVQSRDEFRTPSSQENSQNQSESNMSGRRSNNSSASGADSLSGAPFSGWLTRPSTLPTDDVDVFELKTIKLEYGSKTWRGEKRLNKHVSDIANFRQAVEELSWMHGLQETMTKLATFPLMAAFSIRGVVVVASAQPLSEEMEIMQVDRRDLKDLSDGFRAAKCLHRFSFGEMPDIWVRKPRNGKEREIVRVCSRYDDVLVSSLRSNMVHGVLMRANKKAAEVLSTHDVDELVQGRTSRWTPFLDVLYYQLDSTESANENVAAKQFLLKKPKSVSCRGDVVIAVDPEHCRLPLDLKEAFVQKYGVELLPVLRRLQEIKHMASRPKAGGIPTNQSPDPTTSISNDLEHTVKRLLRRHIRDVAGRLVTLGDEVVVHPSDGYSRLDRGMSSGSSLSRPLSSSLIQANKESPALAGFRRRRSSVDTAVLAAERGGAITGGIYVIDAVHLRGELKHHGVSVRFLPLLYAYSSVKRQPGVQQLISSEIVARVAKKLFQFRLHHDQNADQSRWRSRKSRLLDFMNQIMRGVFDDHDENQFWRVDAPIWLLLGPFSSSIALGDYGDINPSTVVETYRQKIRENPGVLLSSLLRAFKAHLTDGYLPGLDETRWRSLPFIQREGHLAFFDDSIDPKLALTYHRTWLAASLQSFKLQLNELQRIFVAGGGTIDEKSEIQTPTKFFSSLSNLFRKSIAYPSETRLENSISSIDTQQYAARCVTRAHRSLADFRTDAARDYLRQASETILSSGSQSLFPLEMKICLLTLMALCDRDVIMSPGNRKAVSSSSKWAPLRSYLHHFYRSSNGAQALSSVCPHPLAEAVRLMENGTRRRQNSNPTTLESKSPSSASLRGRIEKAAELDLWEEITPLVEKQFRLTAQSRGGRSGNLTIGAVGRTKSTPFNDGRPMHSTEVMKRSTSDDSREPGLGGRSQSAMELAGNPAMTSWDRMLRMLGQMLLPLLTETGGWLIPGYLFDPSQQQQANFPPLPPQPESVPAPGIALLWGRSTGMSLDDESKLSTNPVDGISCRPRTITDVSLLEIPLPTRRIIQISCGYRHTAFITACDYQLYTVGYGECGRLGHGDEQSVDFPKAVEFISNLADSLGGPLVAGARQVACGREHTMVVLQNGELYGFGWAEAGRIGTGESGSVTVPSKVTTLKDVEAVTCGREHTLVLTKTSEVYSFGAGFGGRLGTGAETDEELPVIVSALKGTEIVSIDAGECHSCALAKDGHVYTWGFGSSGALGTGSKDNALVPTKVPGPWEAETDRALGVACGGYHTLVFTTSGTLYGWGDSAAGQLGDKLHDLPDMVVPTPQIIKLPHSATFEGEQEGRHQIQSVACGTFTSAVCMEDGKLFAWGSAAAGNGAKLEPEDAKPKQVRVISEYSIGQVACGAYHTVALTRAPAFT